MVDWWGITLSTAGFKGLVRFTKFVDPNFSYNQQFSSRYLKLTEGLEKKAGACTFARYFTRNGNSSLQYPKNIQKNHTQIQLICNGQFKYIAI